MTHQERCSRGRPPSTIQCSVAMASLCVSGSRHRRDSREGGRERRGLGRLFCYVRFCVEVSTLATWRRGRKCFFSVSPIDKA
jgi:hypothetical protein